MKAHPSPGCRVLDREHFYSPSCTHSLHGLLKAPGMRLCSILSWGRGAAQRGLKRQRRTRHGNGLLCHAAGAVISR